MSLNARDSEFLNSQLAVLRNHAARVAMTGGYADGAIAELVQAKIDVPQTLSLGIREFARAALRLPQIPKDPKTVYADAARQVSRLAEQIRDLAARVPIVQKHTGEGGGKGADEAKGTPKVKGGMSVDEANVKVREELIANPNATIRQLAEKIGRSISTIHKTLAWKAVSAERKKGRTPKAATRLPLTEKMLKTIDANDGELEDLMAEHAADDEPSPLEQDPPDRPNRKVYRQG